MISRLSANPDVARDRALIKRAPFALPAWAFLLMALHYGLTSAYNLVTGSLGAAWEVTPPMALRWGLLTFLVTLPLLACSPLLRVAGVGWRRPRLSSWLLYYGVYAAVSFAGALLRSCLAPWALGSALAAGTFWQLVALLAFSLLSTLAASEVFVARRRARAAWLEASERLERDLARSRSELVEADDRLRRETAEYLHGEVQSRLLMAWALLDQARAGDAGAAEAMSRAQEQLARLEGMGLPQALEMLRVPEAAIPFSDVVLELVDRFRAVMPVELEVGPTVPACQDRLSPELRRAARCLLEEALLNAFRHARAERVRVRFARRSDTELALSVEDDGVGFEPAASPKGLGLSGLGADLALMGGALELASQPGRGTRVALRLPLAAPVSGAIA